MKMMTFGILFLLSLTTIQAIAMQPDAIGYIQSSKGTASILRSNRSLPITVGVPLFRGDTIRTAKDGSVGIVMSDDTTISMGSNSEIALKDYLFNPKENKFAFVLRMAKGTFSYLSGMIGKLSPESIKMEIPEATIAVRGTKLFIKVEE